MKILWLSHLIPFPPKGGVLQRSHYLLKELAEHHDVDLLAFNQKRLLTPLFDSLETGIREAHKTLKSICRRITFLPIPMERHVGMQYVVALKSLAYEPYNINWLKSKDYHHILKTWLSQSYYDLVHFDTISLLPYFNLVPFSTATSLDHHNIESHMLLRRAHKEKNVLKKAFYWQEGVRLARYETRFCPLFSINLTCSDVDSRRLQKLAPTAKICTIPNGVDIDYFKPIGLIPKHNSLIFVGSMSWYPNIQAVLYIADKLWPHLKAKNKDIEFHVIGANPPKNISSLADRLPDFHIHGFVDDVRPYIESASVYVCPIQDGGGTKLKILDAMAMKKAIVAHPIACEGINVRHGQNVILADNPAAFVDQINELIQYPEKREAIGSAARKLIEEQYDYRVIGKHLSDALYYYK